MLISGRSRVRGDRKPLVYSQSRCRCRPGAKHFPTFSLHARDEISQGRSQSVGRLFPTWSVFWSALMGRAGVTILAAY